MVLAPCNECQKEVSTLAASCPNCGAPIQASETNPYSAAEVNVLLSQKKKTNHLLHLLLSIITGGLWLIVWWAIADSNTNKNRKIDEIIDDRLNPADDQNQVDEMAGISTAGVFAILFVVLVIAFVSLA